MRLLRVWIVVLAATAFLAGLATARLMDSKPPQEPAKFELFAERFCTEFGIDPDSERAQHMRVILQSYEEDKLRVERRHWTVYQAAMDDELVALGQQYEGRFRDKVVPPRQRALYESLVGESPAAPATR